MLLNYNGSSFGSINLQNASTKYPSHAPSISQHITDGTFLLPFLRPTNQCEPDAAVHQPTPGSSTLLSSPLQHQSNCLQAINKTIKQFSQHLKAEQLDRQTLLLQLQNDFTLLRYLLFSPVETISNKNIIDNNSTTSPLLNPNVSPNPYPNPNPSSVAFPILGLDEPKLPRSTPVGAVGPPRTKTNNTAKADFQPTPITQEAPSTISHQEFANWKNCLPMKYQLTHPSLPGSIPIISF